MLSDLLKKIKERRDFMNDLRSELAREWAKKHNIQLSLFSRQYLKEVKATNREKKTNKLKNEEKSKEICQGIKAKEFEQMCKKARVDRKALAKTVFTESLKSS